MNKILKIAERFKRILKRAEFSIYGGIAVRELEKMEEVDSDKHRKKNIRMGRQFTYVCRERIFKAYVYIKFHESIKNRHL